MAVFGKIPKRLYCICFVQFVVMILGIVLLVNLQALLKVASQNNATVTQLVDDWRTRPFVDVSTTTGPCPAGTESIFKRRWGGTERGCNVAKVNTVETD